MQQEQELELKEILLNNYEDHCYLKKYNKQN